MPPPRPLRALITRPRDDAAELAAALRQRGIEATIEPLLVVEPIADAAVDLTGVQALLFTSGNGARAFARLSERRDLPVFAVGDATAATARGLGFATVESAGGDVRDLARLVIDRLQPAGGPLFHAAGSAVAGDLAGLLAAGGFDLRRAAIYETRPVTRLSAETGDALAAGGFDLVLLFSPRTAATFAKLVRGGGGEGGDAAAAERLRAGCAAAEALCLSPAVAEAIAELPWRAVRRAAHPDLNGLLEQVDAALAARPAPPADIAPIPMAPAPAKGGRGAGATILVAAAVAAAVALVVTAGLGWWLSRSGVAPATVATADPAQRERLAEIERRLDALDERAGAGAGAGTDTEARLAALETGLDALRRDLAARPAGGAELPAWLAALPDRLATLERRVDETAAQARAAAETPPAESAQTAAALEQLRAELADLGGKVEGLTALERRVDELAAAAGALRDGRAGAAAFMLGLGQFRAATAEARPFAAELEALRRVAGDDAELAAAVERATAPLAPHAESGIPTLTDLRAAFPAVAREVAGFAPVPMGESGGWGDRLLDRLSDLISLRPVGAGVEGDDPAARVARAEARLATGDLAAAVDELGGLTGARAAAAADWLERARARLAVERALAELQAAAIARLAPVPAPADGPAPAGGG